MYTIKFYTEKLGWFSTSYFEGLFGIPFQAMRREIDLNKRHWAKPITYTVHQDGTDITELYERWLKENPAL